MTEGVTDPSGATTRLEQRLVRYADLKPCTTAFIDTRTPGSAEKENFTIIGPGVAENPDQHVHISIPHGFNIGAARQPPNCINSQHSHETAEVFVVHAGRWAFVLGPNQEHGEVILEQGDTISIPVNVFRGFKNIGEDTGFLFAVLGGDDPGHVMWAPYVFEAASKYGLVLLEDGSLVDTARGEQIPPGKKPMPPTTAEQVASARQLNARDLRGCVVKRAEIKAYSRVANTLTGVAEHPIIGGAVPSKGLPAGKLDWPHGFSLSQMDLAPGESTNTHTRSDEEVLLLHQGQLKVEGPQGSVALLPGDTFTTPIEMPRRLSNPGTTDASVYVVRRGDQLAAPVVLEQQ